MSNWVQYVAIAVPASIAAASAGAVAFANSRANVRLALLRNAADHEGYLREKRADVYVPMARLLRKQRWERAEMLQAGPVSPQLAAAFAEVERGVRGEEALDLGAAGTVFVGRGLAKTFDNAMTANLAAWSAFLSSCEGDPPVGVITDKVKAALAAALDADKAVFTLVREEMTWTDEFRDVLRVRKKRRGLRGRRRPAAGAGELAPPQPGPG